MAVSTKRYEVIFLIVSEATSRLNVMDLKIFHTAALLATPAVAVQNPLP